MTDSEYTQICAFVQKHSGIVLGDSKGYLIESRLAPVAQHFGFENVDALSRGLVLAAPELRDAVVDAMTTNESFFFRDTTPFTAFEQLILPKLAEARRGAGRIRIWCAAASTGQEPYSLAMILRSKKQLWSGLSIEIIGTDLSPTALARAKAGKYTQFEVQRGLPIQLLVDNFVQDGTNWIISDEIKNMVKFSQANLLEPMTGMGTVDVVFCRNVLIYFDVPTKKKVLEAVHKIMRPDGFLVLGAAETMMGVTDVFERTESQRGVFQPVPSQKQAMTA
jgi:chemotaxis protein methyltransferase CheR